MGTNDYLPFATGGGANVVVQGTYAAAAYVPTGRGAGILPSDVYNKIARQGSIGAAILGQLIITRTALNAVDDGNLTVLLASLEAAILASVQNSAPRPSRTVLLTGTAATYTTPAGCKQLRIIMVGGGGGGGAAATNAGVNGATSSFNSVTALGGNGGGAAGGLGGTGGAGGTGTITVRLGGGGGAPGTTTVGLAGSGAASAFGGAGRGASGTNAGGNAPVNTGGGGGGGSSGGNGGGGGGSGEYVEMIINSPAGSYTYTVGQGGAGGAAGGQAGGNGGDGIIIIDEFYV